MDFDLVIRNGTIVDGTGQRRFRGHIGIQHGRIAAISSDEQLVGREALDANELIVAPGFVDLHSHLDWMLPHPRHDEMVSPMVLQGITTIVAGNCGSSPAPITEVSKSLLADKLGAYGVPVEDTEKQAEEYFPWQSMRDFLDTLESRGVALNIAMLVGHGTLRQGVMGDAARPATADEMQALRDLARESLLEGAFGLSTGLGYAPGMFAANGELLGLLKVAAAEDAVYTTHSRAYRWVSPFYQPMISGMPHNRRSTREQLDLASRAEVKLQLSHLLFHGRRTWPTYRAVLDDVEEAANNGLDVAFDAFPYTFGNTTVKVNFPGSFLANYEENIDSPIALRKLREYMTLQNWLIGRDYRDITLMWGGSPELSEFEGLNFATIADRLQMAEFEAYMHIARVSGGNARILQDTYSGDKEEEEPLRTVLSHPLCAFETDALIFQQGYQNAATYGTYPRLLGRYSRDLGLFSLEEAIRRMTSFPAERIGLTDVGRIAEGIWADLVLLDPTTIADNTTAAQPEASPTGIHAVLISGHPVAVNGKIVAHTRRGRVLRR